MSKNRSVNIVGPRHVKTARRGVKSSVAIGLSSLLMISLSFMGAGVPAAQGDEPDQSRRDVATQPTNSAESLAPSDVEETPPPAEAESQDESTTSITVPTMAAPEALPVKDAAPATTSGVQKPSKPAVEKPADAPPAPLSEPADNNAPEDETMMRPGDHIPLAMAPMAFGDIVIGQIEARIANQTNSANQTLSGDCLRYATSNGSLSPTGPTAWVSNPNEARGSHGSPTSGSDCGITQLNQASQASTVGIVPSQTTEVAPGQPFLLGAVTHYNNPIYSSSEYFKGDLSIRLSGLTGQPVVTVPWALWETANSSTNCPTGQWTGNSNCRDRITFESQIGDQIITVGGVQYRLVFSGFSPPQTGSCSATPPANTQNMFWTDENKATKSCFYASLEQIRNLTVKKTVPAPFADSTAFNFSRTSSLAGSPWSGAILSLVAGATRGAELLQGETVSVQETPPAGWALQSLQCTYDNGVALSPADAAAVTVSGNTVMLTKIPANTAVNQQRITCTFTNVPTPAVVKLTKAWQNATAGDAVKLTVQTSTSNTNSATSTAPNQPATPAQINAQVGETVTLSETFTNGLTSNYTSNLTCDQGVALNGNGGFTVPATAKGKTITCTYTNVGLPTLRLVKSVDPGATGDTTSASSWTLTGTTGGSLATTITGVGDTGVKRVPAATYSLAESGPSNGWIASTWRCVNGAAVRPSVSSIAVTSGDNWVCTITNTAKQPKLTLIKTVTNNNGGTTGPASWTLTAAGPTTGVTGVTGATAVTNRAVAVGAYNLSEFGPVGYTPGDWSCTGGTLNGSTVAVGLGQDVTCAINNDDQPGELTLVKTVTNDNGGTAAPTAWTLKAAGPTAGVTGATGSTSVTNVSVTAGSYVLSETGGPDGYAPGAWSCDAGTLSGSKITVGVGQKVTCTINNNDKPGTLTLEKIVDNGNTGAALGPANWTLNAAGATPVTGVGGSATIVNQTVDADTYTLTETNGPAGYTASPWTCTGAKAMGNTVVVPNGGAVKCSITNTVVQPRLTLVKRVENDGTGGTSVPANWTLTASSPFMTVTGPGNTTAVTYRPVQVGKYSLSESGGPDGYTNGVWSCAGAASFTDDSVTVAPGDNAVCTVINTSVSATLTLVKVVDNGSTGAETAKEAWTLSADGPSPISGTSGTSGSVLIGNYDLSEEGPLGYDASTWVCTGAASSTDTTVTVGLGNNATCTVTNIAKQPYLKLVKTVTNNNGGTASPTDWELKATGPTTGLAGDGGVARTGTRIGSYVLDESDGPVGYTAGDWSCLAGNATVVVQVVDGVSSVPVGLGQDVVCTINNDDDGAKLTLVKIVDDGETGADTAKTAWRLKAVGPETISGATGAEAVTAASVDAGSYTLSEAGPVGYTASLWTCVGAPVTAGAVVVPNGGDVTCTITNTADQPTLTLVKTVTNDSGGTDVPTDWTLTATGPTKGISGPVGDAGVTDVSVEIGSYVLAESDGPAGYTAGAWSCLAGDAIVDVAVLDGVGTVAVALGQDVVCTINNDDAPAKLTLVKTINNGDTGATTEATAWRLKADGPTPITGVAGSAAVTSATVNAGTYELSESDGPDGYAASKWTCSAATPPETPLVVTAGTVVVPNGGDVTCTITNTAEESFLTLVKTVTNDGGGHLEASAWTLAADGPTANVSGPTGTPAVTRALVKVGSYALTETGPEGYNAGAWTCSRIVDDVDVPITVQEGGIAPVGVGQDISCTINNDDQTQILIQKWGTNAQGVKGPIDGASFEIRTNNQGATGAVVGTVTPVAGEIGVFRAASFDPGIYWLVETGAPASHALLAAPVGFTIAADGTLTVFGNDPQAEVVDGAPDTLTLRITDTAAISLPLTGGGAVNFVVLAILMLGIGAFGVALVRRQRPSRSLTTG